MTSAHPDGAPAGERRVATLLATARLVAAKELRSSLRDPQTLVYALLLPLALYPALFWVMIQVSTLLEGRRLAREVSVVVAPADEHAVERAAELHARLAGPAADATDATAPDDEVHEEGDGARSRPVRWRLSAPLGEDEAVVRVLADEPREADDAARVDAVLLVRGVGADPPLALLFEGARADSALARDRVEARVAELADGARRAALEARGRAPDALAPFRIERRDLASRREQGAYLISVLLPMLIVLMAVFGAFHPAVDVTAGERERKCEETTLLVPAPRRGVWLGKVLAVAVLSFTATVLNLGGIAFAANHLLSMIGADEVQVALGVRELALALPLALALVLFTSAVLTGLASLTRTFKQGQSLLGGVQMAFMVPALVSTLPALSLTPGLAATPVVGIALGLRSVLRGASPDASLAIALVAHLGYAALALVLALRLLGSELDTQGMARPFARLRAALSPTRSR